MRKLSITVLSAAAAVVIAGSMPMAAQAAVGGTYRLPGGNGRVVVIGGNGGELRDLLGQNGICEVPGMGGNQINRPNVSFPQNILPTPGNQDQVMPELPGGSGSQEEYVSRVVALVNEERAKAGLSPLTVDSRAAGAAEVRAREIERSFSHTRPDGRNFNTALEEAGVNYGGAGENIAYGQRSPEEVMEGWMNSAGHRANILRGEFTSIGVGHYKSASGVDYWTQLFAY